MAAPLSVCTEEEQRSVIRFFVVWRCIRGRNPSNTFSTIREQCFVAKKCLRMDRKVQKLSQKCYVWRRSRTPVHSRNWRQHWARTWHGSVRQTTDWLLMKWHIICKLVMVLPIKSSTIDVTFIKFVQDGPQNNSQCCMNKRAWTCSNNIWIAMIKKVTPSSTESSLAMKHGSTITSRSVNGGVRNVNFHNRLSGRSSKANHQQENWCLQFFWDSQGPILENNQERG